MDMDGRVRTLRDTNSLSIGYSKEALSAVGTVDRGHQPLDPKSPARRERRDEHTSSQFFSHASTNLQAVHAEWKEQILQDVAARLDLPSELMLKGCSLLQAREQALLEVIDRLILGMFQDVQNCLDVQAQAAREVYATVGPILTRQQIAVLEQLSIGKTPKEIARQFGVEVGTIRAHQRAAYARLGVSGRDAAVRVARLRGLLFPQNTRQV